AMARSRHRRPHHRRDPARERPMISDLARPDKVTLATPTTTELVTVAVPARNEEPNIQACLRSILDQDWPNLQVIVVDGASSDRTAAIVRRMARADGRIETLVNHYRSIPGSLNLALQAARGRWFVRVDAHSVVPPAYLRR